MTHATWPGSRRHSLVLSLVLVLAAAWVGCRHQDRDRLEIALNWKPEPEFGGIFEALHDRIFEANGLDIELSGGPGAPVIQMVVAGRTAFGIASADEVVIARARGSDVVALFATYQTSPQGLMAHAERGFDSLAALLAAPGILAVEPGLPYVKFLGSRYDLSHREVVPYSYSIAAFLTDPELAQQVFVTAEPIAARRAGAHPQVFLVAESGYNPYTAVLIARGDRVRDDRGRVTALQAALREGWRRYLDDPSAANAWIAEQNPEMDRESLTLAAAAQVPLIKTDATRRDGLGSMTPERWSTLAEQLKAIGVIGEVEEPTRYFIQPGS